MFIIEGEKILFQYSNFFKQTSSYLLISIVLITKALIFYSLGVWAERLVRYLKVWHVVAFWIVFGFDISGTLAMHLMTKGPFNLMEPHTLTGKSLYG